MQRRRFCTLVVVLGIASCLLAAQENNLNERSSVTSPTELSGAAPQAPSVASQSAPNIQESSQSDRGYSSTPSSASATVGERIEPRSCSSSHGWVLCSRAANPPIQEPNRKDRERTADRKFWISMGVSTGLMLTDVGLTNSCVQANRCRELNPLLGSRPSTARIFGVALGLRAFTAVLTYKMKEGRHPRWWLPNAIMSVVHGAAVVSTVAQR